MTTAPAAQPPTAAAWLLALADSPEGVSYGTLMEQATAAGWTPDEVLVAAERQCTAISPTLERRSVEVATGRVLDEAAVNERFGRSGRGDAQALSGLDVRYRRIEQRTRG